MHCTSVYEENHPFLTFTVSATNYLRRTTRKQFPVKIIITEF